MISLIAIIYNDYNIVLKETIVAQSQEMPPYTWTDWVKGINIDAMNSHCLNLTIICYIQIILYINKYVF